VTKSLSLSDSQTIDPRATESTDSQAGSPPTGNSQAGSPQTLDDAKRLIERLQRYRSADRGRLVVAFSGGVDSSVVAAAAVRADPEHAIAMTAQSPSVPQWQLDWACRIAGEIGISHRIVRTQEFQRDDYVRNDTRRCFACKESLYATIRQQCMTIVESLSGQTPPDQTLPDKSLPAAAIVSGTNADDLGDYRPGIEAGQMAGVCTPLADLGFTKRRVRLLAEHFGLSNHDLPASPCLASRVAYGVQVTPDRLGRIERAESWLRDQGFTDLRVRLHHDELARVELMIEDLARACEPQFAELMHQTLRDLGFRFVTIDLGGLQSGSMNRELVTIGMADSPTENATNKDTF
tara:strand:+ start:45921 stop:46967 length:1047 start_codon:yes stop_codon:yes gene_type:complete